jgi:multicomponent K+:H+ antiporter subunit F
MTGPVLFWALAFGFAALSLALVLNLWRLFKGPGVADRILALDTMVINVIGLIVLAGIAGGEGTSFEAALLLAMVGFVSTVAYAKFLLRGDIIE